MVDHSSPRASSAGAGRARDSIGTRRTYSSIYRPCHRRQARRRGCPSKQQPSQVSGVQGSANCMHPPARHVSPLGHVTQASPFEPQGMSDPFAESVGAKHVPSARLRRSRSPSLPETRRAGRRGATIVRTRGSMLGRGRKRGGGRAAPSPRWPIATTAVTRSRSRSRPHGSQATGRVSCVTDRMTCMGPVSG
jgi:hypothetical protein